jgi:hypothetical protein
MSNYKIYGAVIKKQGPIGTGSTENGNKFEEIIKELSQEVIDAQPEIVIPAVDLTNVKKYLTVPVFNNALTSADNGIIAGSVALSFSTFGNTHQIYEVISCCNVGTGTILITIKDRANNVIDSSTLNAAVGTSSTSIFYDISSPNDQLLKFEATTVTGNIDNLAITIELVKI